MNCGVTVRASIIYKCLSHILFMRKTLANRMLFASACDRIQLEETMIMARTANVFVRLSQNLRNRLKVYWIS